MNWIKNHSHSRLRLATTKHALSAKISTSQNAADLGWICAVSGLKAMYALLLRHVFKQIPAHVIPVATLPMHRDTRYPGKMGISFPNLAFEQIRYVPAQYRWQIHILTSTQCQSTGVSDLIGTHWLLAPLLTSLSSWQTSPVGLYKDEASLRYYSSASSSFSEASLKNTLQSPCWNKHLQDGTQSLFEPSTNILRSMSLVSQVQSGMSKTTTAFGLRVSVVNPSDCSYASLLTCNIQSNIQTFPVGWAPKEARTLRRPWRQPIYWLTRTLRIPSLGRVIAAIRADQISQ